MGAIGGESGSVMAGVIPRRGGVALVGVAAHARAMSAHEDVARELLRSIRQIVRQISIQSKQLLRDVGLTVPQMACLTAIAELETIGEEITVLDVGARVHLSPATVSRIVDRLVAAGFVSRERSATDRRRVNITLTAAGVERTQAMPTPLQAEFVERLGALPERRQRELRSALRQVAALMSADALDAAPLLAPGADLKG
jgi:DNA-binding MarR family transcriptional regulator